MNAPRGIKGPVLALMTALSVPNCAQKDVVPVPTSPDSDYLELLRNTEDQAQNAVPENTLRNRKKRLRKKRAEKGPKRAETPVQEQKCVEYQGGACLPSIEWGEAKNYAGCKDIDPLTNEGLKEIKRRCHFFDPLSAGVPLVRIEGRETEKLSRHFEVHELATIDPKDVQKGYTDGDYRYIYERVNRAHGGKEMKHLYKVARIDPKLVALLEEIRTELGFPIVIDEAYRPNAHNTGMYHEKCKGKKGKARRKCVKESTHMSGQGVDIDLAKTLKALRAKCKRVNIDNCDADSKREIQALIKKAAERVMCREGGGGIGQYTNITHVDTRKKKGGGCKGIRRWGNR